MKDEGTGEERPPDEPSNLMEWLWRVKHYEKSILVRTEGRSGRWEAVALAMLPPREWAEHVARWMEEGQLPARIREPEEMSEPPGKE